MIADIDRTTERESYTEQIERRIKSTLLDRSEEELADLTVRRQDFETAIKRVQPSALREIMIQVPTVTWDDVGGRKTSNPSLQTTYGLRYIAQRYGNPVRARAMKTAWLIKEEAIQSYAPTTENLIGQYVSAAQLCAITMRNSDNTAANGVLEMLGGPQAVTSFLRTIGDTVTRLDRNEPSLNEATPGDLRDTTTPQAMVQTLQSLVLGDALKTSDRDRLTDWLRHNEVGGPLLRAGVPESWNVADRTGAAGYGTRGVVAVMWPPERAPLVAAVYITETKASMEARNAAIAAIGKVIAQAVDQKAQP